MALTGWPETQQVAFLSQQFDCQHRFYREHFDDAVFWVLEREQQPVGRLYWRDLGDSANLIDVSLVPSARGQGLGTALMRSLTRHADLLGQAIDLHVEPHNPAHRLYLRFGFEVMANNGVYLRMRREPGLSAIGAGTIDHTLACA